MTKGNILILLLVCFAAIQVSSGLRVRRQSSSAPSSGASTSPDNQTTTTPNTGSTGSTNNNTSSTAPSSGASSSAHNQTSTGSPGSSNDNSTFTPTNSGTTGNPSSSASASASDPAATQQRMSSQVKELLADPGSMADILANFENLMITQLGLDEATAAGMTPNQIKANYIDMLLNSDPSLVQVFPDLGEKLARIK